LIVRIATELEDQREDCNGAGSDASPIKAFSHLCMPATEKKAFAVLVVLPRVKPALVVSPHRVRRQGEH
jgi:hypothetical protein